MKKLVAPKITEGEWSAEQQHDGGGNPIAGSYMIDAGENVVGNLVYVAEVYTAPDARFLAGSKRATDLLAQIVNGLSSGAVEINSGSVGGGPDASPHPWHEEWLHHARTALLASGYQETE